MHLVNFDLEVLRGQKLSPVFYKHSNYLFCSYGKPIIFQYAMFSQTSGPRTSSRAHTFAIASILISSAAILNTNYFRSHTNQGIGIYVRHSKDINLH